MQTVEAHGVRREIRTDPWAVTTNDARRRPPSIRIRATAAWIVGSVGPVGRLLYERWWTAAILLAFVAAGWELFLRRRPSNPRIAWPLIVAVLAGFPMIAWVTIGRAPALLALLGVFAADAALVEWSPAPSWPTRRVRVAGAAMLPLVAAQAVWIRTEQRLPAAALIGLALVTVEIYHRRSSLMARVESVSTRVLTLAGSLFGNVILGVVASVFLYLPGLFGRLRDRARRRRAAESYWHTRHGSADGDRRQAGRPFASVDPATVVRRHLMGGVSVIVAVVIAAAVAQDRLPIDEGRASRAIAQPDSRDEDATSTGELEDQRVLQQRASEQKLSTLPAFEGVEFADELQAEQQSLDDGYMEATSEGLRVKDFSGRFTNVMNDERATLTPPSCDDCPTATVWLMGGSAGFGYGQRDDFTIASDLVRLAAADNISLTVRNFAVPALTIYQEAQKLEARLANEPPPDLVLFYDGYNDMSVTLLSFAVHGTEPQANARLDEVVGDWETVLTKGLDPQSVGSPQDLGSFAAKKYRTVRDDVDRRMSALGVATMYVWQPDALASPFQYEAATPIWKLPELYARYFDEGSDIASSALEPDVLNLRHLFDDHDRSVFFDLMHQNEPGAQMVAESMYPTLLTRLGAG